MIMKAQNYLFAILTVVLMGCTKAQVAEEQTFVSEDSTEVNSLEPEIDTMNLVIEEEPYIPVVAVDPVVEKPTYASSSYKKPFSAEAAPSASTEGRSGEEKRKHSPNDNYLLGFDEDVDDVHDMEIYMEDY